MIDKVAREQTEIGKTDFRVSDTGLVDGRIPAYREPMSQQPSHDAHLHPSWAKSSDV